MRARELFYRSGNKSEEEESLDDATCILHALRTSRKHLGLVYPQLMEQQWIMDSTSIISNTTAYEPPRRSAQAATQAK